MAIKEKIDIRLISQKCADEIAEYYVFSNYTRREIAEQLGLSLNQLGNLLERGKASAKVHELYHKYPSLHYARSGKFPRKYKEKIAKMVSSGVDIKSICEYGKLDESTVSHWAKKYGILANVETKTKTEETPSFPSKETKNLSKVIFGFSAEERRFLRDLCKEIARILED